nr:hypothetical protein [Bacteriovoracaceae bacterium]
MRIFLFLIFTTRLLAQESVYSQLRLGENTQNMSLAETPYTIQDILSVHLSHQVLDLDSFVKGELTSSQTCPLGYLNAYADYMRYLYRILSLSYLYESLETHRLKSYQLGLTVCQTDWMQVLKSCQAKSTDMKKLIPRILFISQQAQKELVQNLFLGVYSLDEKKKWIQKGDGERDAPYQGLLFAMKSIPHSLKDVEVQLEKNCLKQKEAFIHICSENDQLYGLSSYVPFADLLQESHVVSLLGEPQYARGCLQNYGKIFSQKESTPPFFLSLFSSVQRDLQKQKELEAKYDLWGRKTEITGRLFIPATLKEFDDKGLANLLYPQAAEEIPVVIASVPVPTPEVVVTPKTVQVAIIEKKELPPPPPEPSAFAKALMRFQENPTQEVLVDMRKFKKDFIFTARMMEKLEEPLQFFLTQESMSQMRDYDALGEKKEPMRLLFLKLLMDTKQHKGLFNTTAVLGEKFYVVNDLEKKKDPVYVRFYFDDKNLHDWQIALLPGEKEGKKVMALEQKVTPENKKLLRKESYPVQEK